jgi:FkbM family methyltransferase
LALGRGRASRRTAALRSEVAEVRSGPLADRPYLALVISGGLGDFLVIARFVRDLTAQVGDIVFDVFSPKPELARWAFTNVPGFTAAYNDIMFSDVVSEYDVGMRINQFVFVYRDHIRWRAIRNHERLVKAIKATLEFRPQIDVFIDRHPFLDNALARTAVFDNATREQYLHKIAGIPYRGAQLPVPVDESVVARLGLRHGEYVTVHNGFDTGFVISGRRATKCYPHFGAVVARLKVEFPHLQFVQIGSVTSESIAECDLILLDQTSLQEVAGLITGAVLHLDNEGGLVHLAACVGTRSAVVFGPTPSDYFGYPQNINIDPPVCGNCWWITRTWMDVCVKGYDGPLCMTEQSPEVVAKRAASAIAQIDPDETALASAEPLMRSDQVSIGHAGVVAAEATPLAVGLRERLPNIKRKASDITKRSQDSGFRGHPDQAFGGFTYAQFGEDLIIVNLFTMLGNERPSYLDVGAHHPFNISNTALLHARGSRGINVEANPNLIEAFREHRPADINLNVGVGAEPGELNFYFIDDWSGRNTFLREVAEEFVRQHPAFSIRKVQPISVVTLNDIVSEHANGRFPDFLTLDVEGLDYEILRSTTFNEDRPVAICVESELLADRGRAAKMNELLLGRGYRFYTRTVDNLIFVKADAIERLRTVGDLTPLG